MRESQSAAQVERKISIKSDSSQGKSLIVKKIGSSPNSKSRDSNSTPIVLKKASLNMLLKLPQKAPDDMLGLSDEPPNKPKEET